MLSSAVPVHSTSPAAGDPLAATVNSANSSTTPLSGGATFTGTAVDVSAYARISVFIDTDVDGTLKMQFSADGTNWDRTKPVAIDQTIAGGSTHTLAVATQYFRVLVENGASAQSHLRLATILHPNDGGMLSSSPDQKISRLNDVRLSRVVNDPTWDMARNLYADRKVVHKFGATPSTPAAERDVWLGGSSTGSNIDYPWPTAAETVRVKAGGNVNDTAAGTGAREVTIVGLDENWVETSEAVATAGASASSATTTTFIRVFRAYVSAVGTYGGANTGQISLENTTSTDILADIGAGRGQTQLTMYTVPDGYTAYLREANINVDTAANKELTLRMYQRQDADDTSAPMASKRLVHMSPGLSGEARITFQSPPSFPGKTDLWWTSEGTSGSAVSVDYDLWLAIDAIVNPQ